MSIRSFLGLQSDRRWRLFMRKLSAVVLQYLPLMTDILLLSINLMRSFGYKGGLLVPRDGSLVAYHTFTSIIVFLWWCYLMTSSKFIGFCMLHRLHISYFLFAYISICVQRWNGDGDIIEWLAHLCSLLGVVLVSYTMYVIIKNKGMSCLKGTSHND